jgi:hypothetical protein
MFLYIKPIMLTALCGAALMPHTAAASYWMECAVIADVSATEHKNTYKLMIKSATVLNGHGSKGAICEELPAGQSFTVKSQDIWKDATDQNFVYQHKGGMTPNGVFDNITWILQP